MIGPCELAKSSTLREDEQSPCEEKPMNPFDQTAGFFFADLQEDGGVLLTPFFRGISLFGDYGIGFILLLVVFSFFRKLRRTALVALLAILFGFLLTNLLLKNWVARPRPFMNPASPFFTWWQLAGSLSESGYSFPSGHTTLAMAFGGSFFLTMSKKRFAWFFFLIPLIMASSRLYFVVHYASDVLGGMAVGFLCAILSYFLVRWASHYPNIRTLFPE
jgi:undecaprenyl-diphosphatase